MQSPEGSQRLNAYTRLHTTLCESQFYIWAMIIEDKFELLNVAVDTQCNCGETDCQWYNTTITYKALLHKDEIQEMK